MIVGGWTKTRPVSLGLLPSGPDPVGERYVLRQPPGAYVDHVAAGRKGRRAYGLDSSPRLKLLNRLGAFFCNSATAAGSFQQIRRADPAPAERDRNNMPNMFNSHGVGLPFSCARSAVAALIAAGVFCQRRPQDLRRPQRLRCARCGRAYACGLLASVSAYRQAASCAKRVRMGPEADRRANSLKVQASEAGVKGASAFRAERARAKPFAPRAS